MNEAEIIAVPADEGVKLTVHEAPPEKGATVQLVWSKPPVTPVNVKLTEPLTTPTPPGEASRTVAVQGDAVPTVTGLLQETVVVVALGFTVMLKAAVVELGLWVVSPG